ncbi:MAG: hypothetical protein DWI30_07360 [Chloroflexi bacterium]|nr:MAG: hypothetical protein DWI30_07360 [Chloroflexota bacterium]
MQQLPPQRQRILMRIIYRLWRFWIALLVVIVAIPTILTVWYGVQSLWHTPPLIITVNHPHETYRLVANQTITLEFSQHVNRQIVATALQITPPHEYQLQWDSKNTILTITPITPWQPDTRYLLTITPTLHMATDVKMEQPWNMQFTTAPSLHVETLIPADQSYDVALSSLAVMRFSQPMVTATQLTQPVTTDLLHITPPISGTLTWIDPKTLVFRPTHWQADRGYTITSTPQLRDLQGRSLATPLTWKFHTIATRIDEIIPANNSQNVALITPITFRVTGVVDVNLLRNSIAITPPTPTTIDITPGENDSVNVIITPLPQWQIETTYQIQIGGAATTLAYQHIRFRTPPTLRLIARSPGDGQILAPNQDVRFVFNADIDTRTITDAIGLTPPPLHPAQITSNGRDIRIMGSWAANSQPLITIDQQLRSSTGITLSTPITSQLIIDTTSPHITLPGTPGSIVPVNQRTGIIVDNQNINILRLRLYALPPAMLVRVLGMDDLTLQQLDPERYDLPLIDTQTITNPQAAHRIVLPPQIWQAPPSRYLLAIGQGDDGNNDVRILRILPNTLTIMTLGGHIIAGSITNPIATSATITVFQDGQLIEQAQSDNYGIWMSRPHTQGKKYVLLDDSNPPDAAVVIIASSPVQPTPLHVISSHTTTTIGSTIEVMLARNEPILPPRNALIALCDVSGMQLYSQTISFAQNQATTYAQIMISTDIAIGIYTFCGDNIVNPPSLIIHPPTSTHLNIQSQYNFTNDEYRGTITDNAMQPVAKATIYWLQNKRVGSTTSNVNGEFQINTTNDTPLTVVAHTQGKSVVTISTPIPQRALHISTPQQWVQTGKYSTVHIQITDPNNQNLIRPIKLTIQNTKGYVAIRRTVMSDDLGHIALELAVPRGQWQIQATDGILQQSHPLIVGPVERTPFLIPEFSAIYRNEVMQFFYRPTTQTNALLAQIDASGVHALWAPIQNGIISTTIPISTTQLTIAAQTASDPFRQYSTEVTTPQCTPATYTSQISHHGKIALGIVTVPNSTVAMRIQRPSDGQLVAWEPARVSDSTGIINLIFDDDNQSNATIVTIIQQNSLCLRHDYFAIPIVRNQQLSMQAPTTVRIGDDVSIVITLHDDIPLSQSTLTITSTGIVRDDSLMRQSVISDRNGNHTIAIRAKITSITPQLALTSSRGARITWNPTVAEPAQFTSNDGFMLQGKTIINTDNTPPQFDVIHQRTELFRALLNEPYDGDNPSQLAHRLWLSDDAHERTHIITQLMRIQHPNGGWGWGYANTPDVIITTDVVNALASAGIPPLTYQSALTYLKQQIINPQHPATIQALMVHALTQTGWNDAAIFTRLCDSPSALGNEGLAALLLVLPHDYAYAIPALLNELLSRSHITPRGLTWSADPATARLHSSDSVNALILHATLRTSVSTSITNQIQSMLLSRRGSNGWSDVITNARMWAMRDTLFGTLDGQQQVTILDQHGHLSQNQAVSPAIILNEDVTITSNAPVLVGITRPQPAPIASDAVRILRDYTINGQPLTTDTTIQVGDIIDVELNIITFAAAPYLTIQEPLPTIGEVIALTPPHDSHTRIDDALLIIHSTSPAPSIMKCHYRIKITYAGHIIIPPSTVNDGAGTWYAQSQPQSIYVSTP